MLRYEIPVDAQGPHLESYIWVGCSSPLMERFDFFMNSDCAMIKIDMKEFRFVYLQKTREIILLTALRVLFANYRCFILFIKARRIF